jgi:hypothetical protein
MCEPPPICGLCDYTQFPDGANDDAIFENTHFLTVQLTNWTIDALIIRSDGSATNLTFESEDDVNGNTLTVDVLIIESAVGSGDDVEFIVADKAKVQTTT